MSPSVKTPISSPFPGALRCRACAATSESAPGTFVTIMLGLPGMKRGMWTARIRANVSNPPPGAYPTVTVMELPPKYRAASSVLTAGRAAPEEAIAGDAAGLEAGLAAATSLDAGELEASDVGFAAVGGDDAGADDEHARLSNKHETTI